MRQTVSRKAVSALRLVKNLPSRFYYLLKDIIQYQIEKHRDEESRKTWPICENNGKVKYSLIVMCGNRLNELKRSLPALLNQEYENYEVILSLYADKEKCAEYALSSFQAAVKSGKLRIISAEAEQFNNGYALNNGVDAATEEWCVLLGTDVLFLHKNSLSERIRLRYRVPNHRFITQEFLGAYIMRKFDYIEVGGLDVTETELWYPGDIDLTSRLIVYFPGCRYHHYAPHRDLEIFLNKKRKIIINNRWIGPKEYRYRLRNKTVEHFGQERVGMKQTDFSKIRLFQKMNIGIDRARQRKISQLEYFNKMITYYLYNNPKLEFVTSNYEILS